ncbi:MAG: CocE/NonD family hydrolase [Candidatus Sulfotelmatobacter sp.]
MGKKIACCITLFVLAVTSTAFAARLPDVTIEHGVPVKMRDGTILRADIYRPNVPGKFPVILTRTPYDKRNNLTFGLKGVQRGFVVINQDVRGRYSSDGEWYPFLHESEDGYDTVEWAASLPYSDGRVGMYGGSYVGATQMLAAIAHPPHLAGICPVVTASNYHDGWTYQGGAFEQWFNESWTSGLAQDTLNRSISRQTNALNGIATLPLAEYSLFPLPQNSSSNDLTHTLAPYFLDWLAHPAYDDYWKRWTIEEHFPEVRVPALTIAAWYDIFLGGSLRNYVGLKQQAENAAARDGQRLVVTIGGHAGSGRTVGDIDFGPDAPFDEDEITLQWYDHLFKNVANRFAGPKRVKIFVLGVSQWRDEEDWPLSRAKTTKYFLNSGGKANSATGDGTLVTVAPHSHASDRFTYDPANPVPTIGGPLCCDSNHLKPGPRDQSSVESRKDVLVYSTAPLTADLEVTGPVRLELFAASSAVDTDFTAKLVDVRPDGFAQNLTEGIIRARYRNSQENPEPLKPGESYKFNIDLWATSNVFRKGHRIRLEISSSNFPRFDRNMNNGEDSAHAQKWAVAMNTVLHDIEHPSSLILPVVEK